ISALTSGAQAVALIGYRADGKQTNRVVAFGYRTIKRKRNGKKLSEKRWVAEDATTDLWPDRPKRGSRAYPVGSVAAGDMIGVGGYIDPGITRVEADGPTGTVVDRQPVRGGAVVLFARPGSTLAGYDRQGLAGDEDEDGRDVRGAVRAAEVATHADHRSARWEPEGSAVHAGPSGAVAVSAGSAGAPSRGGPTAGRGACRRPGRRT